MNTVKSCNNNKGLLDEVGKLRYEAYFAASAISKNDKQIFLDKYDTESNCISFIYQMEHSPIGSIRANVYSKNRNWQPTAAIDIYKDEIKTRIGLNTSYVESNRFVVKPNHGSSDTKLFFGLFKAIALITLNEDVEFVLTAVRAEHASFYTKRLGFEIISELKPYFGLNTFMVLLAGDVEKNIKPIWDRKKELQINDHDFEAYKVCGQIQL